MANSDIQVGLLVCIFLAMNVAGAARSIRVVIYNGKLKNAFVMFINFFRIVIESWLYSLVTYAFIIIFTFIVFNDNYNLVNFSVENKKYVNIASNYAYWVIFCLSIIRFAWNDNALHLALGFLHDAIRWISVILRLIARLLTKSELEK